METTASLFSSVELSALINLLVNFCIRLLCAALLVFIGMRIVRQIAKILHRSLDRLNIEPSVGRFLSSCVSALLFGLLIFIAADWIGISSASIVALLGSAGIAIGLALQGSLSNFAGGVLILLMKPFTLGDYIVCESGEGTVTNIGIIYTTLLTIDNQRVILPNAALSNSPLTNRTASERRRLILPVGISYEADLRKAKELLYQLLSEDARILQEEGIEVFVDSLGEYSVLLNARGWTKTEDYWQTKWDLTEAIKLRFDEAGIEIPYRKLALYINHENTDEEKVPASR